MEQLALRLHTDRYCNGPAGHAAYLRKLEQKQERTIATKRAKGTYKELTTVPPQLTTTRRKLRERTQYLYWRPTGTYVEVAQF